jgi:hypothetical protein
MTVLAPVLERCAACRSPFAEQINQKMSSGAPDTKISDWLKENNAYISRITLGFHRRSHLTTEYQAAKAEVIKKFKKTQKTIKAEGDLAALVRDQVISLVQAGELMPTLSEGLRAQEMIDRRVEKSADRDLAVSLAGILGGGPVINMIEMEAEEITDGEDTSLATQRG